MATAWNELVTPTSHLLGVPLVLGRKGPHPAPHWMKFGKVKVSSKCLTLITVNG